MHTLAVLHTSMDGLRTDQQKLGLDQQRLSAKMDALLDAMGETTQSVRAIQRRVEGGDAETTHQRSPPVRLTPHREES